MDISNRSLGLGRDPPFSDTQVTLPKLFPPSFGKQLVHSNLGIRSSFQTKLSRIAFPPRSQVALQNCARNHVLAARHKADVYLQVEFGSTILQWSLWSAVQWFWNRIRFFSNATVQIQKRGNTVPALSVRMRICLKLLSCVCRLCARRKNRVHDPQP